MRAAARIASYDAWDLVAPELRGIATLQFPWSARAMDEAGAAIERARPRLVLTYAEAGGWGRAIMLEARRRGIPCAGIQHGFIYRRWLNYLHERDEMQPSPTRPHDIGFPRPDLTVVFDRVASHHLELAGAFPRAALAVTGSPGLERLAARVRAIGPDERATARAALGLADVDRAAVVVSKHAQLGRWLPLLVGAIGAVEAAAGGTRRTRLIVKPHPAETPDLYAAALATSPAAALAPASLDLAALLAATDLVVTVNSTVAIDAMALGMPALSLGVPNNLTPFVVAGGIAGVYHPGELPGTLARLLLDEAARAELVAAGLACAESGGIRTGGGRRRPGGRGAGRADPGWQPYNGRLTVCACSSPAVPVSWDPTSPTLCWPRATR